jgi:hypothetical protein
MTPTRSAGPSKPKRFGDAVVASIAKERYLWIRAGSASSHKFTGIWSVVVDGRVFVRSWYMKASGWYAAFLEEPLGAIRLGTKAVPVRAVPVRSASLLKAINAAYTEKYTTPASIKYVKGFARGKRLETTTELTPL